MSLGRNETLIKEKHIERLRQYKTSQNFLVASIKNPDLPKTVIDYIIAEERTDLLDLEMLSKRASNYEKMKDKLIKFQENAASISKKKNDIHEAVPKEEILDALRNRPKTNKKTGLNIALFIASQAVRSDIKDPAKRYLTIANKLSRHQDQMTIAILYELTKETNWEIDDLTEFYPEDSTIIQTLKDLDPKNKNISLDNVNKLVNNPHARDVKLEFLEYDLNIYNMPRMPENSDIPYLNNLITLNRYLKRSGEYKDDKTQEFKIELKNICNNNNTCIMPEIKPF